MPIPKIKRMLTMRLMSLLFSGLFFVLTIAFLFGKLVMHWSLGGSLFTAAACVMLAVASCVEYLILNRRLASGGL